MRVSFSLVVWGEIYVREFLTFSLPTLLADGNLTDNPLIEGSRFQVITTRSDFELLSGAPLFQRLRQVLPVDFVEIEAPRSNNKYLAVSRHHVDAIRSAETYDAIVILYPDVLWARGSIRYAVERLVDGALALFSPGPTVTPKEAKSVMERIGGNDAPCGTLPVSIAPHELAGLVLEHRHPMWDSFDWDGDSFTTSPACLRWNVSDEGWLIRCFHLHPVIMRVQRDNPMFFADFYVSLDGEYTARLFDGLDRLAFAIDSTKFAIVTLRAAETPPLPVPGNRAGVANVARWAEANALLLHRSFIDVAFRWHRGSIDESVWRDLEQRSQKIVEEIRRRLQTPDSVIRAEDPIAYRSRKLRRRHVTAWRPPRVGLLPSYTEMSRIELARLLAHRLTFGTLWHTAGAMRDLRLTRWLMENPTFVRLWQRIRPLLRPTNELDGAVSKGSLLRHIVRANHRPGKES